LPFKIQQSEIQALFAIVVCVVHVFRSTEKDAQRDLVNTYLVFATSSLLWSCCVKVSTFGLGMEQALENEAARPR